MYTRSRVSAFAGHPGETDVGNFVLQPVAARKLSIPFVTSGGVGDGKQLAASLALGAEGVNLGTRFMATLEAPIHANIKQALVDGDENSTQLVMRTLRNTERVYKNRTSDEVLRIEAEHPGEIDKIIHLVRGDVCAATRPTHAAPRTHTARGPALYPKPRASTMLRLPIFRHRAGRTTAHPSRKQGTSTPAYGHAGQSWALLMMFHRVRPSCRAWWTRPRPLSRDGSWRCAKMTEWSNSSAYTELLAPKERLRAALLCVMDERGYIPRLGVRQLAAHVPARATQRPSMHHVQRRATTRRDRAGHKRYSYGRHTQCCMQSVYTHLSRLDVRGVLLPGVRVRP